MADESKGLRDVIKLLMSNITTRMEDTEDKRDEAQRIDLRALKDILGMIGSWAGKGKDEVVQVLCREIGLAVAAMIKEPVTQILENRKLQITLELIPKKNGDYPIATKKPAAAKKKSSRKRS